MNQCQSKTTKRAWNNPLAPMAQCSREAKMVVENKALPWGEPMRACTLHSKKLLEQGWTEVKP